MNQGFRCELQLRDAALPQRIHQRSAHDFVNERLIAEAHFGFGRVDVDVHGVRRHLDEQIHLGTSFLDRGDAVGVDDGVRDRPVLDDATVDEHVLGAACRPLFGKRRDEAGQTDATHLLGDVDEVGPLAVQLIQAVAQRCDGGIERWSGPRCST